MNPISLEALTRRASLVAAGAAGLAMLASPKAGDGKKKRKSKKGDINQFCKPQVEQCLVRFNEADSCEENPYCECCSFFGTCDITGFFDCFRMAD
jgi:hypothetical protein